MDCRAPLSMGFPKARILELERNTGVGCHFLLQGIFPFQGSNSHLLCFLHCRWILYHWATREAIPRIVTAFSCCPWLRRIGNKHIIALWESVCSELIM